MLEVSFHCLKPNGWAQFFFLSNCILNTAEQCTILINDLRTEILGKTQVLERVFNSFSIISLCSFHCCFYSHLNFPALVNYHLLNSVQCSEAIMVGSAYETEEGSSIEIGCDGDSLTVNGIKMVLKKDIVTTNGVIHLIDEILIPDSGKKKNK